MLKPTEARLQSSAPALITELCHCAKILGRKIDAHDSENSQIGHITISLREARLMYSRIADALVIALDPPPASDA